MKKLPFFENKQLYWLFLSLDSKKKVRLEEIQTNSKSSKTNSEFVDSEFVKPCDEFVICYKIIQIVLHEDHSAAHTM